MKNQFKVSFRLTEDESDKLDLICSQMVSRISWRKITRSEAVRRLISEYCKTNKLDPAKKSDKKRA